MLKIVYLFLVFAVTNVFAQQQSPKQLNGKVTADAAVLEGVYVLNKKQIRLQLQVKMVISIYKQPLVTLYCLEQHNLTKPK